MGTALSPLREERKLPAGIPMTSSPLLAAWRQAQEGCGAPRHCSPPAKTCCWNGISLHLDGGSRAEPHCAPGSTESPKLTSPLRAGRIKAFCWGWVQLSGVGYPFLTHSHTRFKSQPPDVQLCSNASPRIQPSLAFTLLGTEVALSSPQLQECCFWHSFSNNAVPAWSALFKWKGFKQILFVGRMSACSHKGPATRGGVIF